MSGGRRVEGDMGLVGGGGGDRGRSCGCCCCDCALFGSGFCCRCCDCGWPVGALDGGFSTMFAKPGIYRNDNEKVRVSTGCCRECVFEFVVASDSNCNAAFDVIVNRDSAEGKDGPVLPSGESVGRAGRTTDVEFNLSDLPIARDWAQVLSHLQASMRPNEIQFNHNKKYFKLQAVPLHFKICAPPPSCRHISMGEVTINTNLTILCHEPSDRSCPIQHRKHSIQDCDAVQPFAHDPAVAPARQREVQKCL